LAAATFCNISVNRSVDTTAPREFTCNTTACAPLLAERSSADSISSTTTWSISPLTATTSTGARSSAESALTI